MTYTIKFTLPDLGRPVYASSMSGFALELSRAVTFNTEEEAAQYLADNYGGASQDCGAVVEVEA